MLRRVSIAISCLFALLVALPSSAGTQAQDDTAEPEVIHCDGGDGDYTLPAVQPCSSIPEFEDYSGYDATSWVCNPPDGQLGAVFGLLSWACAHGFVFHNRCDGYYLEGEVDGHSVRVTLGDFEAPGHVSESRLVGEGRTEVYLTVTVYDPTCEHTNCNPGSPGYDARECERCAELKPLARRVLAEVVGYSEGIRSAICSGRTPKTGFTTLDFQVTAEKKGFEGADASLEVTGLTPSTITVTGTVTAADGTPVEGCTVSAPKLGVSTVTDAAGNYTLTAKVGPDGAPPYDLTHDFELQRRIEDFTARIVSPDALIANGRVQKVRILVEGAGRPYAAKKISVSFAPGPFRKDGEAVDYVTHGSLFLRVLTTDAEGTVTLAIPAPVVVRSKLNNVLDSYPFFPVEGRLLIEAVTDEASCTAPLLLESPFPRIERFTVTGNIDAGTWQMTPSRVVVSDPDSRSFKIRVRGAGRFKTKGGPIYPGGLWESITGNEFRFYYRPPQVGFDLNDQPDLWMSLLETNMKVAASFLATTLEGWALPKAIEAGGGAKGGKALSEKILAVGKPAISELDYYNSTMDTAEALGGSDSAYDKGLATLDWVIGGTGIVSDILQKGGPATLAEALTLEAMKAVYENAKTTYAIYKKYQDINNAYQDVIFIPLALTVEDPDGHRTHAMRACSVRIWKKVQ